MFIKNFIYNILIIILLCLIQIMIFNQINILSYLNIHIYIIFVFIYPVYANRFIFIILSFLMGLIIDYFMNTGGIHTFSITLISYLKQDILRFIAGKNIITGDDLSIFELSFNKKVILIFLIILLYYFSLFLLEIFKISDIKTILIKSLTGIIFNTILSIIYISITEKKYIS